MTLKHFRRALTVLCLAAALGGSTAFFARGADPERFSRYVDDAGNISLPPDYQTTFVHLGTFAVATKPGGPTDQIHGVYARPEDIAAYRRDGRFPDGAVLVKDVYDTSRGRLTTGDTAWGKQVIMWFVMVKDARGRFPGNRLWGDGWGWALFEGKDPGKQVATNYRADCRTCHLPARTDDWLYVDGYPVLHGDRGAKQR